MFSEGSMNPWTEERGGGGKGLSVSCSFTIPFHIVVSIYTLCVCVCAGGEDEKFWESVCPEDAEQMGNVEETSGERKQQ